MTRNAIIVTRHPALVTYLNELGITGKVIPHASEEDVRGKHVYGVLPHRLSSLTSAYTEVSMVIPPEFRGKELTLENIKSFNPELTTYLVDKLSDLYAEDYPPIEEMEF